MPLMLPLLAIERSEFQWGNPLPGWLAFLLVLGLGVLVFRTYRREAGGAGSFVRLLLATLRLALVLLVLALICEPQIVTSSESQETGAVAVLVDRSRSMSLVDRYSALAWGDDLAAYVREAAARTTADAGGTPPTEPGGDVAPHPLATVTARDLDRVPRIDIARLIAEHIGVELADTHAVTYYAFDSSLVRDARPSSLSATGGETHLGEAVADLSEELSGRLTSAIFVITDGQSNGGTRSPADAADLLVPPSGLPVYAVGVGDPTPPRDIWITDLQAPERALVDDGVAFDFVAGNYGFEGESVIATLEIESAESGSTTSGATATITLGAQGERKKGELRHTFKTPGDYVCRVRLGEKNGELATDNNVAIHHLKVLDRRIKVLYIEGYPRWEYRALTRAMIRDRSLEAYCLLQSADAEARQEVSPGFKALRDLPEPPTSESVEDPLFAYDVIIIGDVDLDSSRGVFRLDPIDRERLVTFVERTGGGVAFISGTSHNPVDYDADEDLRKLLPAVLESSDRARAPSMSPFNVRLTPEGLANPVMRLFGNEQENRAFIEGSGDPGDSSLAGFYWFFPITTLKPTTQVLASHPSERDGLGRPRPIFTLQQVGKGRVFWTATDEIWRWRRAIGDRYYYRFWGQIIRNLAQGKLIGASRRVSLYTDRPEYTYGEAVRVTVELLERNFKPTSASKVPEVEVLLTPDDLELGGEPARLMLLPTNDPLGAREGFYSATYIASATGTFTISLADPGSLDLGEGTPPEAVFRVREPAVELAEPYMDAEELAAMAGRTGKRLEASDRLGQMVLPHELPAILAALPPETLTIPDESIPPDRLWHPDRARWLLLLVLGYTLVLAIEWVTRKLNRML